MFRPRRFGVRVFAGAARNRRGPRPPAVWPLDYAEHHRPCRTRKTSVTLNERAQRLADHLATNAAPFRIDVQKTADGARILDCGVKVEGGLQAGLSLARICLAGMGEVS